MWSGQIVVPALLAVSAIASLAMAGYVWARREGGAGRALAVMLLATAFWNVAYFGEVVANGAAWVRAWGDLKYVGISALAPAWLLFVLCWTGRSRLVTRRLVAALMVEPVLTLALLANDGTHDLIRVLTAPSQPGQLGPDVDSGPLFWFHLAYVNVSMLGAVVVFIVFLLRQSSVYRPQAALLIAASLLPWVANLGYNLELGAFAYADLTPPAFVVAGVVLTWGLLTQHLLRLAPIAERQVVAGLSDAVLVLDIFGHLVETNPAADKVLQADSVRAGAAGRALPAELADLATGPLGAGARHVQLRIEGALRDFEVDTTDLPDQKGHAGGRLVVMRDITERRARERQLTTLLAERARVADTLSRSLRPDALPVTEGVRLAAAYRPAGGGREIGGDFYDVYPAADGRWNFAIGDVSGKGASAAAVTALGRYSLRAFASAGRPPARTLALLNRHILNNQAMDETYLTLAYGTFGRCEDGSVAVAFTLGGHPPPLLVRRSGGIGRVGGIGAAIGLFPELQTTDTEVRLAPGETLVFYTDGVTEARRDGRFFGEDGLVRCLSRLSGTDASTLADGILRAVLDFQEQDAADDIAALVIQAPRSQDDGSAFQRS